MNEGGVGGLRLGGEGGCASVEVDGGLGLIVRLEGIVHMELEDEVGVEVRRHPPVERAPRLVGS